MFVEIDLTETEWNELFLFYQKFKNNPEYSTVVDICHRANELYISDAIK